MASSSTMADQFRFSVKIMPPPRKAHSQAPHSPLKPLAQFMIGTNPRESFEDVWKKIQVSFENSYDVQVTGQGWFHKLQTADGFDIVVSKDKVGNLGFGPHTPPEQLQLVMLLNPIDREGSLAYTSALRPSGFKRPRLSAEEESRAKRQRLEEERYGARIEEIDTDFPVISRESEEIPESWPKDDDGFIIPKVRASRSSPLLTMHQPRSMRAATSFSAQRSPSASPVRRFDDRASALRDLAQTDLRKTVQPEQRSRASAVRQSEPRQEMSRSAMRHTAQPEVRQQSAQPPPLSAPLEITQDELDDDYDKENSPGVSESMESQYGLSNIIQDSQPSYDKTIRAPPTPVSAEDTNPAPTSAQRPRPSPPDTADRGRKRTRDFSIASSSIPADSRDASSEPHPPDIAVRVMKLVDGSGKNVDGSSKKPANWSSAEDVLVADAFKKGLKSSQIMKRLEKELGIVRSDGSIRAKKKDLIKRGILNPDKLPSSQRGPASSPLDPPSTVGNSPFLPQSSSKNSRRDPPAARASTSKKTKVTRTPVSRSSSGIQTKLPFTPQPLPVEQSPSLAQSEGSASVLQSKGKERMPDARPNFNAINRHYNPQRSAEKQQFADMLSSGNPKPDETPGSNTRETAISIASSPPSDDFDNDDQIPADLPGLTAEAVTASALVEESAVEDNVQSTYGSSIFNKVQTQSPPLSQQAMTAHNQATNHERPFIFESHPSFDNDSVDVLSAVESIPATAPEEEVDDLEDDVEEDAQEEVVREEDEDIADLPQIPQKWLDNRQSYSDLPPQNDHEAMSDAGREHEATPVPSDDAGDGSLAESAKAERGHFDDLKGKFRYAKRTRDILRNMQARMPSDRMFLRVASDSDGEGHELSPGPQLASITRFDGSGAQWKQLYRDFGKSCKEQVLRKDLKLRANADERSKVNDERQADEDDNDGDQQTAGAHDDAVSNVSSSLPLPPAEDEQDDHQLQHYKDLEAHDTAETMPGVQAEFSSDDEEIEDGDEDEDEEALAHQRSTQEQDEAEEIDEQDDAVDLNQYAQRQDTDSEVDELVEDVNNDDEPSLEVAEDIDEDRSTVDTRSSLQQQINSQLLEDTADEDEIVDVDTQTANAAARQPVLDDEASEHDPIEDVPSQNVSRTKSQPATTSLWQRVTSSLGRSWTTGHQPAPAPVKVAPEHRLRVAAAKARFPPAPSVEANTKARVRKNFFDTNYEEDD